MSESEVLNEIIGQIARMQIACGTTVSIGNSTEWVGPPGRGRWNKRWESGIRSGEQGDQMCPLRGAFSHTPYGVSRFGL